MNFDYLILEFTKLSNRHKQISSLFKDNNSYHSSPLIQLLDNYSRSSSRTTDLIMPMPQGVRPSISFSCSEFSQDMVDTFDRLKRANISTTEVTSCSTL